MLKRIEFYPDDPSVEINRVHPGHLEKTASYSNSVANFIGSLIPNEEVYYLLINALGAGEYYGANRNGDYFPKESLQKYHKTFEEHAKLYKHHKNKPKLGHPDFGEILLSHYNPEMHRVELIVSLNVKKASDLKDRIDSGEYPAVSMGARVPYDICSVCGHKAVKVSDYCEHASNSMNRVLNDGRKVYVINTKPTFFDLSFVRVPADRTAGMLSKVASLKASTLSAKLAEDFYKESDINKIIDAEILDISKDPNQLIYNSQPKMPKELIEKLSSYPLSDVLSTLACIKIMPRREDFQKLAFYATDKKQLADELDQKDIIFSVSKDQEPVIPEDVSDRNFSQPVLNTLQKHSEYLHNAPLTKPVILKRVIEKYASQEGSPMEQAGKLPLDPLIADVHTRGHQVGSIKEQLGNLTTKYTDSGVPLKNPLIAMGGLGGLYLGLSKVINNVSPSTHAFNRIMMDNPWLLPLLIGGATMGTVELQKRMIEKKAGLDPGLFARTMVAVPSTYLYSGAQEIKRTKGKPISQVDEFVRKHPFLSSLGATYASGKALKLLSTFNKYASVDTEIANIWFDLSENKFDSLYLSVIS